MINAGSFSVSNNGSRNRVINTGVGAGFTVNGGVVEVVSKASDSEGLCADYLNVYGGSVYVEATDKYAIWCDKMEVSNGTVKAKSDDTAVRISYEYKMTGGVLEAESTADKALYANDGIDLTDINITEPENGKISADGKTIVESDGTTEAKKVKLDGSIGYSLWVGSTEVTESNKDDIPGVTGGSASYDPATNTLTFTGDVTGVTGLYDKGGNTYQIYSEGYLTIEGNAILRNTDAYCGIYSNGKLSLKGNFDVYGTEPAVAAFKGLSINGRLDAESKNYIAVLVNSGDITINGDGLFAKTASTLSTVSAIVTYAKIVLKSGVLEGESPIQAISAAGIQIPAEYDVTIPEYGKIGQVSGVYTVCEFDGTTAAKHARIEGIAKFDVWVGKTRVTSLNMDDIETVVGGKASYDPVSSTLTFTGDVTGVTGLNAHDAFDAQIFSMNDLTIAGDVKLENDAAMYGIYTKGKLTVDGNVSAKGKSHGVFAENSDLIVNGSVTALSEEKIGLEAKDITVEDGTLIAKGENSAIDAGSITVDGGSVSANVSGLLTLSKAMKISGDVELKSGSITVTNAGNDESDGLMAGGKVTVGGGKMKIAKSGVGGAALHAGGGVYVEDGELDIFCDDNGEHYTSRGIEESFISIKNDGKVNIETKGITSKAISDTTGYDINIDGGSLNVSCESIAVICSKFVLFDGDVNIEAANTALDCALLIVHEGKLEAWNKAEEGTGAIKSQYEIDLGAEVAVLEPAGGKLSDDKTTVVDSEGKAANKVELATPAKYKLWVGSTQVTEANRDDIPGINGGGKASYDPESKTLIFSGDVKGVTGVDAAKEAQIYAAQDLTISGNAILTDDTAKYGILVESNDLTIKGDVEACGTISAIYASKDITVDGNVSVTGNCTDGVLSSYEGNIILNSGSITVNTDSSSMGAVMAEDIVLNSGSFTAAHKNGAAVIADRITVNGGEVSVSGKKGLDASHIIINGGNSTVSGNDVAVSAVYEFDMKGGNLKAASETGRAISAASVKISDKLMITEPEGGKISSDGTTIVDSADAEAKSVTIVRKAGPVPDDEADVWNLFEAKENSFEISGITAGSEVANTNTKSVKFYTAKLNGNTISVELNPNVDRKKAAKQSNCILEFRLESGETVEYVMPVQYVKPAFKLSTSSVVINNGSATDVSTQLLYKTKAGSYEPYDLSSAEVMYGSIAATGDDEGYISFSASSSMSGAKLSIKEEDWEKAVELKFSVKATEKDVLNVDLSGRKIVILNTNVPDQKYFFDVTLNGQALTAPENVKISCKADGIASIDAAGRLVIALPSTTIKAGNYTVKLESGKAKASVKVKISNKALDSAITMKIRSKYDVVTGQKMVVEPVFKDAGMSIDDVTTDTPDITAELNDAGNIEIAYTGSALDSKNLKIGDIVLKLTLDGVTDPVSVRLKNVKAKKSTPKVKAGAVNISPAASGEIKGSVNIVSTVKDGSGRFHLIAPVSVDIVSQKKAVAEKNALDMTEIDIKSIDAKSGSIKLKLTYPGNVTRNVTIKVKKK